MDTVDQLLAAKAEKAKSKQRKQVITWLVAIPVVLLLLAILRFLPDVAAKSSATLTAMANPAPRHDVEVAVLLDNSGSVATIERDAKLTNAKATASAVSNLGPLLGPFRLSVLRFGHTVTEISDGTFDSDSLLGSLKRDYIDASADPEGGTYLASALGRLGERATHGSTLIVIVASTSFDDDQGELNKAIADLTRDHAVILAVVGAEIHNVRTAKHQLDLRGTLTENLRMLKEDARVFGKSDMSDCDAYLLGRLTAHKVPLAGGQK